MLRILIVCFLVNYQFNQQTLLTQRMPRNHLCLDFIKYTSVSCAAKQTGTLSAGILGWEPEGLQTLQWQPSKSRALCFGWI